MYTSKDPPFYLVWNSKGRTPCIQHATQAKAREEAERLAKVSPGCQFFVLAPISCTEIQTVITNEFVIPRS